MESTNTEGEWAVYNLEVYSVVKVNWLPGEEGNIVCCLEMEVL